MLGLDVRFGKVQLKNALLSGTHTVLCFYGMFHVTWITFKFNRNQLGTVLAYVM